MMRAFTYEALPSRVRFGSGAVRALSEELARLGCHRALILSTAAQTDAAQKLASDHADRIAGVFSQAEMHTPVAVTERAIRAVEALRCDGVVSLGGGSTTGLGKAIALRTDLPQVAVPTTYAGSEATPILGETKDGLKTTLRDLRVLPETIIYDVDLTLTLPVELSMTSGLNAIAHAAEALYARDASPFVSLLAEDGIRAFRTALPAIRRNALDKEARALALYGAWACGSCLGSVGMSIHHKLCHTLGGSFNLPHAETHAVLLPHSVAYNQSAAPEAMKRIAAALGTTDAAMGLHALAVEVGAPTSLQEIGMARDGLDRAADLAAANPYWNPRPIEREAIRGLLERAFNGQPPVAD